MEGEKEFLQDMQSSGYIMAELYYAFVKWVEEKAKYPIKIALRDGEPIDFTAKWLGKRKLANTKDWSAVHLNRKTTNIYCRGDKQKHDDLFKYFEQEGLNKTFTYVDVGMDGSIPCRFKEAKNQDMQTLLIAGCNVYNIEQMSSFLKIHRGISDFNQALESSPKKYKSFEGYEYYTVNEKLVPKLEKTDNYDAACHKAFYHGLDLGLSDCSTAQENSNIEQFSRYLKELYSACDESINALLPAISRKHFLRLSHNNLQINRKKIEEIYRGV